MLKTGFSKTKKLLALALTFALLLSSVTAAMLVPASAETAIWDGTTATAFAGGTGTSDDPYQVTNGAELALMAGQGDASAGKHYKLMNDIYLNDTSSNEWKTSATQWVHNSLKFQGNVDGDGHVIDGLYYNGTGSYVALIPRISGTTSFRNIIFTNASVTTTGAGAGILTGFIYTGSTTTINGCYIAESVDAAATGSGVAGFVPSGVGTVNIEACASLGTFTANHSNGRKGSMTGDIFYSSGNTRAVKINNSFAKEPFSTYFLSSVTNSYTAEDTTYTVKGTVVGAENMVGAAAATNMPDLDWEFTWETTDGYPYYIAEEVVIPDNVWDGNTDGNLAGSGTVFDPYQIATAEQLAYLISVESASAGKYYELVSDIELNYIADGEWYTGNQWYSSTTAKSFAGYFEGNGHTVSGLYFNGSAAAFGLFPVTGAGAVIANVGLVNSDVMITDAGTGAYVGGIVGKTAGAATIMGCYVGEDVTISNSSSSKAYLGGIAGGSDSSALVNIKSCYFLGTLEHYEGGRFGAMTGNFWAASVNIENCYAKGYVMANYVRVAYTGKNNYGTVSGDSAAGVTVITAEQMLGTAAKTNMPNLDWNIYSTTDTYPVLGIVKDSYGTGNAWSGNVAVVYASGTGTASDPYVIENAEQLALLVKGGDSAGKYYVLAADIILNDSLTDSPIAWYDAAEITVGFQGTIDGQGHTISGLYYNGANNFALFPNAKDAVIKNIRLSNSDITTTATSIAGFVAPQSGAVTFIGCNVDNTVSISGATDAAGYVTYGSSNVTVTDCAFSGNLSGTAKVGAYIGDTWGGTRTFTNSYAVGFPFQGRSYGEITLNDCYGTVAELATVAGNFDAATDIIDAELMLDTANMPKLSGMGSDGGYPWAFYNGVAGEIWTGATALSFAGGDGSSSNPYIIENGEQLARAVRFDNGYSYSVTADIALNAADSTENCWFDSSEAGSFKGSINGNDYVISGLYYNEAVAANRFVALFPQTNGAVISNISLINSEITLNSTLTGSAATYVGGIVGYVYGATTVFGCYVDDSVVLTNLVVEGSENSNGQIGGIVAGGQADVNIDTCIFTGVINRSEGSKFGAAFGDVWSGTKTISNTFVANYVPVSARTFNGSNNFSTTAPNADHDLDASFTVVTDVTGKAALDTLASVDNGRFYFTPDYVALLTTGKRLNDVNGDRQSTADDIVALRKQLLGVEEYGLTDINESGTTDIKDLVSLKKKI